MLVQVKPNAEYFDGQFLHKEGATLTIADEPRRVPSERDRAHFPDEVRQVADSNGQVPSAFSFFCMECVEDSAPKERPPLPPSEDDHVRYVDLPPRVAMRSSEFLANWLRHRR